MHAPALNKEDNYLKVESLLYEQVSVPRDISCYLSLYASRAVTLSKGFPPY